MVSLKTNELLGKEISDGHVSTYPKRIWIQFTSGILIFCQKIQTYL